MILVGEAATFLPHLIAAWNRAGDLGAGGKRLRFQLTRTLTMRPGTGVKELTFKEDGHERLEKAGFPISRLIDRPCPDTPFGADILSPLRLGKAKHGKKGIDWGAAFHSLSIRLSLLSQVYCGGVRPDSETWDRLTDFLADPGVVYEATRWVEGVRYSSTQKNRLPIGGIMGAITVQPVHEPEVWWRWWQAAEIFHLGKGTSIGLGRLQLQRSSL